MAFPDNLAKTTLFFLLISIFSGCQVLRNLDILSTNQRGVYHTVQKGQTLHFIARAYNVNLDRLKRINGVYDPSRLQIGTRLWIPGARQVLTIDSKINKQVLEKNNKYIIRVLNKGM